jgi:hypothetical protein
MPILRDWNLEIDADMVLRGQGANPHIVRARSPALVALAEQALVAGLPLLQPAVVYRQLPVESRRHERLTLAGGATLTGPLIAQHLGAAERVVIALCTIGEALEQRVSALFARDPTSALALDGLGSAAVEALATAACHHFESLAAAEGLQTSLPLNPGLTGWPLADGQRQIFALLDGRQIGVTLTASSLMLPRKSTSFVLGFGHSLVSAGQPCDYCHLRETCRYQERDDGNKRPLWRLANFRDSTPRQ